MNKGEIFTLINFDINRTQYSGSTKYKDQHHYILLVKDH